MLRLEHISTIAEEEKMIPIHIGLKNILKNGKKIQDATGEKLSTFYLLQSISMAIQRGNGTLLQKVNGSSSFCKGPRTSKV